LRHSHQVRLGDPEVIRQPADLLQGSRLDLAVARGNLKGIHGIPSRKQKGCQMLKPKDTSQA